jgi:hypothetical protein
LTSGHLPPAPTHSNEKHSISDAAASPALVYVLLLRFRSERERGQAHIRREWHYWEENVSIKRVLGATHAAVAAGALPDAIIVVGDTRAFILSSIVANASEKRFRH